MPFDHRRQERYHFSDRIEFAFDPFTEDEIYEGTAVNFNESGLCILTSVLLKEGQEITVKNFLSFSSRTAVVLWIEKYDDIFYINKSDDVLYRVGLVFV